ncbi:MAG TPA: colanic acid biosynthesis glycosyltransferase WcaI [Gammaproteobacteria bacterium]|uniref:glycosyltransferase WbuB n=1 Tax=Immundisolibacter sp. TaxID=1934948 RepID=UPI000E8AF86A|nr:colanic acid biosynthesis glycosyltransferase WcaI [Gammaproteobacteria bacterium]MCH77572.1 colanic acid biosynthesis glycosyltransferase WcaI [Gammaproteobacteria bacterium]
MRVLLHCLNFSPEVTGAGKYSGEMAHWLAQRGHSVRVVTAPPYYPQWRIAEGFSRWRHARTRAPNKPDIWRAPLWVPARPSGAKRLLHLFSFALSSLPVMLWQAAWRPDIVVVVAPTLVTAPAAWITARLSGAKAWLHLQDFELDAAFALGILEKGHGQRLARRAERALLRRFDRVSTISDNMLARLASKGVDPQRAVLFPNWVDTDTIHPLSTPSPFRHDLGISPDQVVVLYSGNMGRKQGLEILADAARQLRDDPTIRFVLAGAGEGRAQLEAATCGLSNVHWLPLQPTERLNDLLNLADIHVLPQRADAADLVMPSKLTGMLASGRPVVATAAPDTQVARVVAGCGLVSPPEDPAALGAALRELANQPETRRTLGEHARQYAQDHLGRDAILAALEARLKQLIAK